jgi:hypothetical protein
MLKLVVHTVSLRVGNVKLPEDGVNTYRNPVVAPTDMLVVEPSVVRDRMVCN